MSLLATAKIKPVLVRTTLSTPYSMQSVSCPNPTDSKYTHLNTYRYTFIYIYIHIYIHIYICVYTRTQEHRCHFHSHWPNPFKMSAEFIQFMIVNSICPRCPLGQKGWCAVEWLQAESGAHNWCFWNSPFSLFMAVMGYSGSAIQQPTLYNLELQLFSHKNQIPLRYTSHFPVSALHNR